MLDLPHGSIEMTGKEGGCKLDGGYDADVSLTSAAMRVWDSLAIGDGG